METRLDYSREQSTWRSLLDYRCDCLLVPSTFSDLSRSDKMWRTVRKAAPTPQHHLLHYLASGVCRGSCSMA
jgi:hypothetical protein